MIIDGGNHCFDGNNTSGIIKVNSDINLTIKNLTFKNINPLIFNITKDNNSTYCLNLTLINCKIANTSYNNLIEIEKIILEKSYSGKISDNVIKLTKQIVGKLTDLQAARRLAIWVKKNIKHETKAGFYQTPDTTILRGVGNCACHTELFLQMCIVIGLNKNHRIGFVHTGSLEFHYRHFFAIIDNLVVDTDSHYYNPWGHASIRQTGIYKITDYPLLPIPKTY